MGVQFNSLAAWKWIIAALIAVWVSLPTVIQVLLWFMGADFATGIAASLIVGQRISREISFKGFMRKGMILLMILMVHKCETFIEVEVHVSRALAVGFICNEFISILINMAKSGVPIPLLAIEFVARFKKLWRQATPEEIDDLNKK